MRNVLTIYAACSLKMQSALRYFLIWRGEFKLGSLKLPSWELFCVSRHWKQDFRWGTKEPALFWHSFGPFHDALRNCEVMGVECPVHKVTTTAEVLLLHSAMNSFCRKRRKSLSSSKKVAPARKKVKIMRRLPVQLRLCKQVSDYKYAPVNYLPASFPFTT